MAGKKREEVRDGDVTGLAEEDGLLTHLAKLQEQDAQA